MTLPSITLTLSLILMLTPLTATPVAAQAVAPERVVLPTDRTVLPLPEPAYPHSTTFDARNAAPPPRFEVKAPATAPNVLIVLIDDMGFGQSSAFGGPIKMPAGGRLANNGLGYKHFHTTALCPPTPRARLSRRKHTLKNKGAVTGTPTPSPRQTRPAP